MSWIRVDVSLPTHRKSMQLAHILKQDRAYALMIELWCWAKVNAPDGRIGGRDPVWLVEQAAGWKSKVGAFVTAALEVGFLERDGDALVLHDWDEHNGKALKRAEESAGRMRAYRERKEAERIRKRNAAQAETEARTQTDCVPNANGTRSVTQTDCVPIAEQDETRRNKTRRDSTRRNEKPRSTTTLVAGPEAPPPPPNVFRLEPEAAGEPSPRKLSAAQVQREHLRAMRATALPGVVDDVEIKPGALTQVLNRLEGEATAKGGTLLEAYAAYLQDDYARSRNPPCPLSLFVDGNKFRECLSAALRLRGKGPPLTLVSSRRAGGYASMAEIQAQDFTVDPLPDESTPERKELQ